MLIIFVICQGMRSKRLLSMWDEIVLAPRRLQGNVYTTFILFIVMLLISEMTKISTSVLSKSDPCCECRSRVLDAFQAVVHTITEC